MNVIQVNKLYYPHIGGVENHVRVLATRLNNHKDVEVEVLAANEELASRTEVIDGVPVTKVASLGRVRSAPLAPGFAGRLRGAQADIFHFHFPNPTGELAYLLTRPKGKLVVTYHSDIVRQKLLLKFYRPFLERFLGRADRILVGSPNLIQNSPFLQEVKDKCVVVPFGIEPDWLALTPEVEERVARIRGEHGPRIAFFLGRLIHYKGVEYLVRAMRDIDAKLIVAGDGELGPELKQLAKELGVASKIAFVGTLSNEDVCAHYHACDLFVLPSVTPNEAYGLVQLEAHACGKPVVSTNLPTGVPFVNVDGVTGLIVPPRDEAALAAAINRLLDDDTLRETLGSQAKERFEREFTSEVMVERILAVYRAVLDR